MREKHRPGPLRVGCVFAALLVPCAPISAPAAGAAAAQDLGLYREARARLAAGDLPGFERLEGRLRGFPLYPYLQYAALRRDLKTAAPAEVRSFLQSYPNLPITPRLRAAWLRELGRGGDWKAFLAFDPGTGGGASVRCYRVQALAAAGRAAAARSRARRLWLVGYRQPPACNAAFALLGADGGPSAALVARRIVLALEAGNLAFARELADRLPPPGRTVARARIALYRDPGLALRRAPSAFGARAGAQRVLVAAFLRAAARDPAAAHAQWSRVRARWKPDAAVRARVAGAIALQAAYHALPQAEHWLAALAPAARNDVIRAWRVRNALRAGRWPTVLAAVRAMPAAQRTQPVWLYWEARALAATGHAGAADRRFRRAAAHFSYYGFLAADAAGVPYYWGDAIPAPDPALQSKVRARGGTVRALLLERAGQYRDAEEEWRALLQRLDPRARLAAARVARGAKWPWGALHAAVAAGVDNASTLLFPAGYRAAVERGARAAGLPAAWVLATIRRESGFKPGVCSDAGACGLMQLMPGTARWLQRRAGADRTAAGRLAEPARNVELGSAYLHYLDTRFGSLVIGSAAYNAGPARVAQWLDGDPPAGGARWIETLPYGETRDYLQAILFNAVVYELRLTGRATRIQALLRENRYAAAAVGSAAHDRSAD